MAKEGFIIPLHLPTTQIFDCLLGCALGAVLLYVGHVYWEQEANVSATTIKTSTDFFIRIKF
jgi:hypothetical protein